MFFCVPVLNKACLELSERGLQVAILINVIWSEFFNVLVSLFEPYKYYFCEKNYNVPYFFLHVTFSNDDKYYSCMLYSGVLTILSQLVTEIILKVVIDILILQMKNLKLGVKYNLPRAGGAGGGSTISKC